MGEEDDPSVAVLGLGHEIADLADIVLTALYPNRAQLSEIYSACVQQVKNWRA